MSVFVGGYTPGTSPWKMGIRTGAQTPETTELLWLPLPKPILGHLPLKDTAKTKSAFSRGWIQPPGNGQAVFVTPLCCAAGAGADSPYSLCPGHPPARAEQAPQVIVQKNESSVSLIPAVLLPGELSPSVQTGNSFPNCVFSL